MQPKMCSKCKKNVAVVFITKVENGVTMNEGYCLKCARSLCIPQIDQAVKQMGISEEDLDMLTDEMSSMFGQRDDSDDADDDEIDSQTATFPLLNQLFGGNPNPPAQPQRPVKREEPPEEGRGKKKNKKHKFLDSYCMDLTGRAREGKLDKVIGRDVETERVIQILNRRQKNNPCLIGEPGVGKTAIAEGLAQRIANGESTIIIGSRSAIFMPFRHLKLIVVDEEYDSSYKQGETPRYNGRDAAKMMGEIYHCPIVLGAATPSIATYHAAKTGKIELVEMKHRVFQTKLPAIHIYDLKGDPTGEALSHPMVEMLRATIARKEKSILLLNRRGFSTTLMCADCGYVFKCPNCDVSLVYHKDTAQLKCHYCETVHPLPHECPKCHSRKILYLGRGTQHVEEDLHEALAEARIQRFDVDSTQKKNSARTILEKFRRGDIDILFGTQMVAKGHDIPGVQTVGILSADGPLNMPSYLASEQTFNLITQCAGRAGRGREQGEVLLQTYNPDHYVIQAAARQDYEGFYRQEIEYRRLLNYPPFSRMMKITCFHKEEKTAAEKANRIYHWLLQVNPQLAVPTTFTPPFDEPIKRVRNMYYISILIKGRTLSSLKSAMRQSPIFEENDIIIDVDPM